MNGKLLTLLHYIQSDELMRALIDHEDQIVLLAFLDFLTVQ